MATVQKHGVVPFTQKSTVRKDVLNYASLGENSNKYYIIELQDGDAGSQYPYRIYTEYGRMGKTPRQENRFYNSLYQAEDEYRDIVSKKNPKAMNLFKSMMDSTSLRRLQ